MYIRSSPSLFEEIFHTGHIVNYGYWKLRSEKEVDIRKAILYDIFFLSKSRGFPLHVIMLHFWKGMSDIVFIDE